MRSVQLETTLPNNKGTKEQRPVELLDRKTACIQQGKWEPSEVGVKSQGTSMSWRAEFRTFRCGRQDRDDALDEATTFAGQLKAKELIGISHVVDKEHTVVAVWFWSWGSYWTCPQCAERVEVQFDSCWNCSTPRPHAADSQPTEEPQAVARDGEDRSGQIEYLTTRGAWLEWDDFFSEIAKLASAIGPERLIGIAHSGAKDDALATVFYWSHEYAFEPPTEPPI